MTFKGTTYIESSSFISEISDIMTSVPETPNQNKSKSTSNMTPVQSRLDCSEPDCSKSFVNKRNMTKHKDKFHMMVSVVSKSPIVNTVRTLFSGDNNKDMATPSTQGNSKGLINSPKVVSGGFFQCNECTYEFTKNQ